MRYKGILHITGEHDTGKTLMALGACHPSKTAYFFDDVKYPPIDPDDFGLFVDLVNEAGDLKLLELREYVIDRLRAIDGLYDGIIFDTWSRVGLAFKQYAKTNPTQFREKQTFSSLPTAKGAEWWLEANRYEARVISKLSNAAPFVALITHLKNHYSGGVPTGRQVPDSGKSLDRVCNLRVWLRHNEDSGVPIALILKRLAKTKITENGLEIVNVLPRRLKPLDGERSVWDVIDRYRQEPYGNREPTNDEKPTPFELSILDGILTEDQKEVWRANLEERRRMNEEESLFAETEREEVSRRVNEMSSNGSDLDDIHSAIQAEYGDKYDFSDIVEMIG